jgi:hypothetical protein
MKNLKTPQILQLRSRNYKNLQRSMKPADYDLNNIDKSKDFSKKKN